MSFEEIDSEEEPSGKIYVANELGNDNKCAHVFKRKSPNRIECTKCHVGLYDDPTHPAPIEALNEYYSMENVQKYNRWL